MSRRESLLLKADSYHHIVITSNKRGHTSQEPRNRRAIMNLNMDNSHSSIAITSNKRGHTSQDPSNRKAITTLNMSSRIILKSK